MASSKVETGEKVRLGFSPYTYARVAVMKSVLFKREDYERMLKMGSQEILRFLQDTQYKNEIDEYDLSGKGSGAIESALNANLMRNFQKLYRISDKNMQKVMTTYLLRYDLENIKMILRSKSTGVGSREVEPLLFSSVNFNKEFYQRLLSKSSWEEVIQCLPFLPKKKLNFSELFEVENALDKYYLETLYLFARNLKGQGKIVAQFLKQEIDITNLKTILRLMLREKKEESKINYLQHLVNPSHFIQQLLTKDSLEDLVKLLHKHKYISLKGEEEDLLTKLEMELSVFLLRKESLLIHQHLLSANYILGYLFAKETEVRNLKTLVKGKKLAVPEKYLEQLLVIAA